LQFWQVQAIQNGKNNKVFTLQTLPKPEIVRIKAVNCQFQAKILLDLRSLWLRLFVPGKKYSSLHF
jgi:hypothetical protein